MRKQNLILLTCVALIAGCDKQATGQVVAVVNGEEITLQELNAELENSRVPSNADRKVLQRAALQRVVERRLLAQQAKDDGLDKTPEFMMARRQLEENLLVQQLTQSASRGAEVPDQRSIDQFIKKNPTVFEQRTLYQIDRIQFPTPSDPKPLSSLEQAHTMDEVAEELQAIGIEFKRGPARLDSAQLSPTVMQRILALPQGEPFILPENGSVTVGVITAKVVQPISGEEARPLAVQAMRNLKITKALEERLKQAKSAAEIEYQPGFEPPEKKESPDAAKVE